jgi:hypothetical protein
VSDHPATRPVSASRRARRNAEIAEARASGLPWAVVAARFGVSERTARRAEREHLAAAAAGSDGLALLDPAALLRQVLEVHVWALARLGEVAGRADNTSSEVGAIRSRAATARDLLALLSHVGLLPAGPAGWSADIELRVAAAAMVEVARRHGLPPDEILAELDERLPALRPTLVAA